MRKLVVLSLLVFGLFLAFGLPVFAEQAGTVEISGEFQGTPQYLSLEVLHSGTLTLTAQMNGVSWSQLDGGKMSVQMSDGRQFKIQNMWRPTANPGEYQWVQYLPGYVSWLWIDNPKASVVWNGFGPFSPRPGGGIAMSSPVTQIALKVRLVGNTDRVWRWELTGEPKWAADQWKWWDQVRVQIFTNCPRGLWWQSKKTLPATFEKWLPKMWVRNSASQLTWYVDHPQGGGWAQIGAVLGPRCWFKDVNGSEVDEVIEGAVPESE